MLGKKPNKVYDPHLKTGLGYENLERLKKAVEAQPKMYDGERLESTRLKVDLPDYEETLEDAEKSRLKMKDKTIPLDYAKLNALYESFVPQTKILVEQTYFSFPCTSNISFESSSEKSDLPPKKMPNESKLLKLFVNLDKEIKDLEKLININLKMDKDITLFYDDQVEIRRLFTQKEILEIFESMERKVEEQAQKDELFQNEIDRLLEASSEREIKDCVLIFVEKQKNEMLILEKEKNSNDSKDIQANLLKRIKILENDFQQREKIKLEYQKLFNSIKTTRVQHQQEVNELIENVNQKTYAYGDVHFKNQDLLRTISELKDRLKIAEKGKNVFTKFDKFATLGKLLCVTPIDKNKDLESKMVSKVEVKTYT
ncbi:hypothetical protein Tco_0784753 [Tanacetum coccineum]